MPVYLPTAGVHQHAFSGGQQKMLDEFVMRIRSVEARVVPFHPHLPAVTDMDFPEAREPGTAASTQEVENMTGQTSLTTAQRTMRQQGIMTPKTMDRRHRGALNVMLVALILMFAAVLGSGS